MNVPIVTLFSLALAGAVCGGDSWDSVGEWSSEQQNLKARLLARYQSSSLDGKPEGPYSEFLIYLELQNTSPATSTIVVTLELDPATNITYRVTDSTGSSVEPERAVFRSTVTAGVYSLVLPAGSMLRFPVSLNGGGVFTNKAKLDVNFLQGIWYFDKGPVREWNLSGTLRVPTVPERYGTQWWRGALEIPPVKLTLPFWSAQPVDGDARPVNAP